MIKDVVTKIHFLEDILEDVRGLHDLMREDEDDLEPIIPILFNTSVSMMINCQMLARLDKILEILEEHHERRF